MKDISKSVQIITKRLIIREPDFDDIRSMVTFVVENRSFHEPFEPIRSDDYYTDDFWKDKIQTVIKNCGDINEPLQLCIIKISKPQEIIGIINFQNIARGAFQACHIGYMLAENEQGKGYMTEALEASVDFMFRTRNFHRIMANYLVENERSAKILQHLGFQKEGLAKKYLRINGDWRDHILTSIINPGWKPESNNESFMYNLHLK